MHKIKIGSLVQFSGCIQVQLVWLLEARDIKILNQESRKTKEKALVKGTLSFRAPLILDRKETKGIVFSSLGWLRGRAGFWFIHAVRMHNLLLLNFQHYLL